MHRAPSTEQLFSTTQVMPQKRGQSRSVLIEVAWTGTNFRFFEHSLDNSPRTVISLREKNPICKARPSTWY